MTPAQPAHKRILLKLSGEALMGDDQFGINRATIERMVSEIAEVTRLGVEVAVVIGGGNIFRGVAGGAAGMDRATADYMGMLATVMNSLALADAMNKVGLTARVMSAIGIDQVVEPYVRPKALQYLEEGKVVVFAAGADCVNRLRLSVRTARRRHRTSRRKVMMRFTRSYRGAIVSNIARTARTFSSPCGRWPSGVDTKTG